GFGKLPNRELDRISKVDGAGHIIRCFDQSHQSVNQVVNIAERSRLVAFAVDGDVLIAQRLHHKVRYDATVVWMHTRSIGVEDPCNLNGQAMLTSIIEEQRLRTAFTFVVTRT